MKNIVIIIVILIIILILFRINRIFYERRTIRNLLVKLINEFEKEDVKYWVDFGSLLGMMREKDVILGDNDGDVCILKDDKENTEKVQNIVQRMGGKFFYWGAFRVFDKDIFIDIFLVKEDEIKDTKHLIFPTIKETVCLGDNKIIATIPNKPKEFLEARYGKDWTVQKYKWYFLYF
jgi:hypothetical protein